MNGIKPGALVDFDTRYGPWHGVVAKVSGPVAHIKVGGKAVWTMPIMKLKVREL